MVVNISRPPVGLDLQAAIGIFKSNGRFFAGVADFEVRSTAVRGVSVYEAEVFFVEM